jgi:ferredoxin
MIDGKAVLVSEHYCDGFGACIGDCPVGAITIEEREAEPYSEKAVMKRREIKTPTFQTSELRQFPVQLRLLNPHAVFLRDADLLLAADCTAFASGEFHSRFLKGRMLAIACPKLDDNSQAYVDKLKEMIDVAQIRTLTALIMEVPCCSGLVRIAEMACQQAERNIPLKVIVLAVNGELVSEK